jgi:hypothetical protein
MFLEMDVASKWVKPHSWFVVWYKVHFLWHTFYVYFLHSLFHFCMSCIKFFFFFKFKFSTIIYRAFEHDFWLKFVFSQFWAGISILFLMIYCKYCDWRDFFLFLKRILSKRNILTKLRILQFCRLNLKFTYKFLVLLDPVGLLSTLVF